MCMTVVAGASSEEERLSLHQAYVGEALQAGAAGPGVEFRRA